MSLNPEALTQIKELSQARHAEERVFYSRRPEEPFIPITRGDGSEGRLSGHDLKNVSRQSNGGFLVGSGDNQKVVSAEQLRSMRDNFRAAQGAYNRNYEAWHKEGWGKGFIAGSPNERL